MRRFPLYERHRPLSLSSPRCSWRDGDRFAVEPHAHHGDVELRQSIGIVHKKVLGYEDLNDHDELRRDPMMAVLAGKLAARREDCAPLAGKSTLNRLELSRLEPTRYHRHQKTFGRPVPGGARTGAERDYS
jgi:hypothetical protein